MAAPAWVIGSNIVVLRIMGLMAAGAGQGIRGAVIQVGGKLASGISACSTTVMTGGTRSRTIGISVMHSLNSGLGAVEYIMTVYTVGAALTYLVVVYKRMRLMTVGTFKAFNYISTKVKGKLSARIGRCRAVMTGRTRTSTIGWCIMHRLDARLGTVKLCMTGSTATRFTYIMVINKYMVTVTGGTVSRCTRCYGGNYFRPVAVMTGGARTVAVGRYIM